MDDDRTMSLSTDLVREGTSLDAHGTLHRDHANDQRVAYLPLPEGFVFLSPCRNVPSGYHVRYRYQKSPVNWLSLGSHFLHSARRYPVEEHMADRAV
jgi:hypothetical protein